MERRLAAILLTDMVGYSRLMGLDEEGTIARQKAHREEIIDPKISAHGGRIVKSTGDGVLVEFPSVVDAVKCAVEVQQTMAGSEADVPEERRIHYRIGINLGDIVIDGEDILGDGVNVAARLEALAKPGGICISGTVHDQLTGKIDVAFEDAGEQSVKNVPRPVRVWHWQADQAVARWKNTAEPLPLPDKPSIAVLPFANMSGEPEQDYFSDGISEDIITALSSIRWFFIIARNSSFAYKGTSPDIRTVAAELGVAYVLEGSVRKFGNRIRITAQLIEGVSGNHVWAKRYDRELEDIFTIQDEITETIVGAIEPEMARAERERTRSKRPHNLHAWDLFHRGMWHIYRPTRDDLEEAQRLFTVARDADPSFSQAYSGAVEACFRQVGNGLTASVTKTKTDAERFARRAVELDSRDAFAHFALGRALTINRQHSAAIPALETAIQLNPSFAQAYFALGFSLCYSGHPLEAVDQFEHAMRLSPQDPYFG